MKLSSFLLVLAIVGVIVSTVLSSQLNCLHLCKFFMKSGEKGHCLNQCKRILPRLDEIRMKEGKALPLSDSGVSLVVETTTAVNMRDGPCTDRGIVKLIPGNTRLIFTGQVQSSCGYNWISVTDMTANGWVAQNFVKDLEGIDVWVTASYVNVRNGPCTDRQVVATVQNGQQLFWRFESADGCGHGWRHIFGQGIDGWVAAEFVSAQKPGPGPQPAGSCRNFPLFKQCDGRWGGNRLGNSCTICGVGCLVSSVSMALAGAGRTINGQAANPGTLVAFLNGSGGFQGCNFYWGTVGRFGFSYQGQYTDQGMLKANVCNGGKVVILAVNNYHHYVLARGHDANGFFVNDPGYNKEYYSNGEVAAGIIYNI